MMLLNICAFFVTISFIEKPAFGQEIELPTAPCPPVCFIFCAYGNVMDSNGCPICQCNDAPDPWHPCEGYQGCSPDQRCVEQEVQCVTEPCYPQPQCREPCGPVCDVFCAYGNVMDSNGCPTCQCNDAPDPWHPCEGYLGCSPDQKCVEKKVQCVTEPCYPVTECKDKCIRRKFDYNNREYFEFEINDKSSEKEFKATKFSGSNFKGDKGDLNILLRYVFEPTDHTDNRGFRGEICLKVKNVASYDASYAGIPKVTCNPFSCSGVGGGVYRDPTQSFDVPKAWNSICLDAPSNSFVNIQLHPSKNKKIRVKAYNFKGCEKKT